MRRLWLNGGSCVKLSKRSLAFRIANNQTEILMRGGYQPARSPSCLSTQSLRDS